MTKNIRNILNGIIAIITILAIRFGLIWKISNNTKMNPSHMVNDNETLIRRLEHINSWINNCDQKASILLAFVGVVIPLVFSSDIFSGKLLSLVNLIKAYSESVPGTCFSLYNTICCTLFIITIIFAVFTIHHLIALCATMILLLFVGDYE